MQAAKAAPVDPAIAAKAAEQAEKRELKRWQRMQAGAAELATSPAHLVYIATELRWRPDRLAAIAAQGRKLSTPAAADITAEKIVRRIENRPGMPKRTEHPEPARFVER